MSKFHTTSEHSIIPNHIAVIMDGNRRWAKEHGLSVLAGHKKVTDDILESLIDYASTKGVKYMTFWAWSTENWGRSVKEVSGIMRLFRVVIEKNLERLHKKGVRIIVIGDYAKFDRDIREGLDNIVKKTAHNTVITVALALNYGGRDEIVRAVRRMVREQEKNGETLDIQKDTITQHLDTVGIPDPDIIVRAGGEMRLSGFLLWQCEYSELYFPEWFMPDFTPERLDEVLDVYAKRKRRFGK